MYDDFKPVILNFLNNVKIFFILQDLNKHIKIRFKFRAFINFSNFVSGLKYYFIEIWMKK